METLNNKNYESFMLYFTFFLLWVSIQFGEVVEDFIAYVMVVSIGILHGANDLLILSKKDKGKRTFIKNLIIYIGIIGFCLIIYIFNPFVAILLFVFLSAYHFGEEHLGVRISVNATFDFTYFLAYGLFIFSLLLHQSIPDVDKVMRELTGTIITVKQIEIVLITSASVLFLGSVYLFLSKRVALGVFVKESFYLLLLFLVFKTSSLILGFAIYFILWHSIPSIMHQIEFISGDLNKANVLYYFKKALLYWGISIVSLFILYQIVSDIELFSTVIFAILFAVTAPHAWVMFRMKN
ncbi:hypothetical protein PI23P_07215 [Polaribacter irgensii 23-P]|uniref:Probable beta-carotene 15,15'-dioxygenase n=1 Tax=Polaribacter irgensii 23-P TaxID=313594 RepID=A4BZ02_9FLAO|nr:Brp/Blh family beta-carotene 15,15'-dioxygenase [Polaribacter irgensii]EAR12395.1 hypothetical protein PI23P_07215 [Polaribacter irgensii 23-P]